MQRTVPHQSFTFLRYVPSYIAANRYIIHMQGCHATITATHQDFTFFRDVPSYIAANGSIIL